MYRRCSAPSQQNLTNCPAQDQTTQYRFTGLILQAPSNGGDLRRVFQKAIWCAGLIVALLIFSPARAQNMEAILDQSFHAMYNLQFDEAFRKADQAKALDKTDPMPWVAQASAVLFREFDRLHILRSEIFTSDTAFNARPSYTWKPDAKKQFDDSLATAEKLSRDRLDHNKNDVNALFAMVLMNGLRA